MLSLWEAARTAPPGLMLEFGVATGVSLKAVANAVAPREVYGFDWFQGLPEAWESDPKGMFACARPTDLPDNAIIVEGLFQETLEPFLQKYSWKRVVGFVHIDCDIYSSTAYVLDMLGNLALFNGGCILAFDEIIDQPGSDDNERKAFEEFRQAFPLHWEKIGKQHRFGEIWKLS